MSPFTPQLRLHDRYVLRERIGSGGMSEVWYADDDVLHRPVAVKVLASPLASDPALRAVIQREARAAARLTHPHITQVYDFGEAALPGGVLVPYLVMELVQGRTLADRLTAGPLPWRDVAALGAQVAGALAAAHAIGVVHRDIKPANVMLTATGAKVLDFGIAALTVPGGHRGDTGPLMGTPAYTAPERLGAGPPDPASDVYALGVLLYVSLTGRLPLPGETWADAIAVQRAGTPVPPLDVPGLPARTAALVTACLATDPARRPTADDLARRLTEAPRQDPPTALLPKIPAAPQSPTLIDRSAPPLVAAVPQPGRGRRPLLVGGAAAAVLAVVLVVAAFANGTDPDPPGPGAGAPASSAPAAPETTPADPDPTTARPVPTTPRQILDAFDTVIDEAEAAGQITAGAADRLRDRVKAVREKLDGKPKELRRKLLELRREVTRSDLPDSVRQRLAELMNPLNVSGDDSDDSDDSDD
ncbi:protein kinase [Micromonospora sp. CPCC 206060]|uniref:protein kinase domain-containing protein n=1 Tax=Micromonospora sp. CPCC 206060 TaxID=3122406 RepID=UPI002FEF3955